MGFIKDNLGSVIAPVTGLVQGLIDRKTQLMSQARQNTANMQLAEYQYNKNLEMYNKANLYNSPAEQMARFKAAGLNPNLIYGQGSSGNAPNTLPQYHSPDVSAKRFAPVNPMDILRDTIAIKSQSQALKNMKTQGEVLEADRDMKVTQASNMAEYWYRKLSGMYYSNENLQHGLGVKYNIWTGNKAYQEAIMQGSAYQKAMSEIAKNRTMLGLYNSQIALNEKKKELSSLEIANFLPPYIKTQSGLWGNIAKTVFGANKNYKVGVMSKKEFEESLNRPGHYQGW